MDFKRNKMALADQADEADFLRTAGYLMYKMESHIDIPISFG